MDLQQLRAAKVAVRNGFSLTAVAQVLHTSQPGVSQPIRELEDELGIEMLDATNLRRVGEEFSIVDTGRLSIAATHSQARYALPPVVRDFRNLCPSVTPVPHLGSPTQLGQWQEPPLLDELAAE